MTITSHWQNCVQRLVSLFSSHSSSHFPHFEKSIVILPFPAPCYSLTTLPPPSPLEALTHVKSGPFITTFWTVSPPPIPSRRRTKKKRTPIFIVYVEWYNNGERRRGKVSFPLFLAGQKKENDWCASSIHILFIFREFSFLATSKKRISLARREGRRHNLKQIKFHYYFYAPSWKMAFLASRTTNRPGKTQTPLASKVNTE